MNRERDQVDLGLLQGNMREGDMIVVLWSQKVGGIGVQSRRDAVFICFVLFHVLEGFPVLHFLENILGMRFDNELIVT